MASAASTVRSASTTRSTAASNQSRLDYDPSLLSSEPRAEYVLTGGDKKRHGKPRWISHVKNWLTISEPSAQAMKEQKKATYKKHGVNPKDPQAAAKMHFPTGKVPATAITSTSGPTPERAFKEKLRATPGRPLYAGHSQGSQPMSSGFSSALSMKGVNPVAPWDS